jgi:protoporphyrinogen/coproporphyrinogen III oxidase
MNSHHTVAIIGGGISGLATAWWLFKSGVDVIVLESDSEVGGTMKTIRDNGWLIETGPNSALETSKFFQTLVNDLSLQDQFIYADEQSSKRYIVRNGKLHLLPMKPLAFLKSNLWTLSGKLRLLKEPFIGKAEKEESIAEFVQRRLGKEFLDYAINPFVAGVYAGNPEELSVRAAFPKLYALEEKYGGLIQGMIKGSKERRKRGEESKQSAKMFSFKDGMQVLPCALKKGLHDHISTSTVVDEIKIDESGYLLSGKKNGESFALRTDVVVTAIPSFQLANLLSPFDKNLSAQLQDVFYPPVAEVFFGYRREDVQYPLDGFGFLIPVKEKRNILGSIWSSSLFPNRAPENHVAFTTFVGGSRQPEMAELNDDELMKLVIDELRSLVQATGVPVYHKINRWKKAIPQYRIGHHSIVEQMEHFEKNHSGFFISGNFRGGIAVGDCITSSDKTATSVKEYLKLNE